MEPPVFFFYCEETRRNAMRLLHTRIEASLTLLDGAVLAPAAFDFAGGACTLCSVAASKSPSIGLAWFWAFGALGIDGRFCAVAGGEARSCCAYGRPEFKL